MSPQAKKKFLIIFGSVMIIMTIGIFIAMSGFESHMKEQAELTAALPENVTKLFSSKHRDVQATLADEFTDAVNFNSYLYFSHQHAMLGEDIYFSNSYDKSVNKKLGTDIYYGKEDLDGIVYALYGFETVGYYYKDGLFSNPDYSKPSSKRAMQAYVVLSYATLPDFIIIRQDTIWGGEPPSTIDYTDNGATGKGVKDKEIIAAIKAVIK
jgi:hypothetical protein